MVFEPYMIEPLCLTMKCGSTFSPNSNKVFDMIRISSDHVPGMISDSTHQLKQVRPAYNDLSLIFLKCSEMSAQEH